MKDLVEHGVRYRRTLPCENDTSSPIGRSWKATYNVQTKKELEATLNVSKSDDGIAATLSFITTSRSLTVYNFIANERL